MNALRARSREEESHPPPPRGALGVALITIIDGADDLAAYTPFFAAAGASRIWVTCVMFVFCVAAWCLGGRLLTRHPAGHRGHRASRLVDPAGGFHLHRRLRAAHHAQHRLNRRQSCRGLPGTSPPASLCTLACGAECPTIPGWPVAT